MLRYIFLLFLCCVKPQSNGMTHQAYNRFRKTVLVSGIKTNGTVIGSGVAVQHEGKLYFITARHVVISLADKGIIDIQFCSVLNPDDCTTASLGSSSTYFTASMDSDIIVFAVDELPAGIRPARMRCGVAVGETVYTSGAPLGRAPDITRGIVSFRDGNIIFSDNRTAPGNSGGPVFDTRGRVVAISIAIERIPGESAIPSSSISIDVCRAIELINR